MKTITIQKLDGKYSREDALKVFGWIDSDIEGYGCSGNDPVTPETAVNYGKMEKNGTFIDIFGSAPEPFTKAQVIDIVTNHSDLLNDKGFGNLFPYANGKGERFVLGVHRDDSEWDLDVYRLEYGGVWDAEDERVIFLPQRDTLSLETADTLALGHSDSLADAIATVKEAGYVIYKQL